jgi:hypothetical protein
MQRPMQVRLVPFSITLYFREMKAATGRIALSFKN